MSGTTPEIVGEGPQAPDLRIRLALEIAALDGLTDGGHHKMWVIDQMVRALTGCPNVKKTGIDYRGQPYEYVGMGESAEYRAFVDPVEGGWDEGIAP